MILQGIDDGSHRFCEPTNDSAFGFHNYFKTTSGNICVFAVIPSLTNTCVKNTCPDDSVCSLRLSQTQEQRQTRVVSHELAEMISDPMLDAWTDMFGKGENGDICNGRSGTITIGSNLDSATNV